MLIVVILSVDVLNVDMLNVIMLKANMLSVVMLNVIVLNVIKLNIVAPTFSKNSLLPFPSNVLEIVSADDDAVRVHFDVSLGLGTHLRFRRFPGFSASTVDLHVGVDVGRHFRFFVDQVPTLLNFLRP